MRANRNEWITVQMKIVDEKWKDGNLTPGQIGCKVNPPEWIVECKTHFGPRERILLCPFRRANSRLATARGRNFCRDSPPAGLPRGKLLGQPGDADVITFAAIVFATVALLGGARG